MKKFKFRLEKILQYRDTIKTERLRDLKEATVKLRAAEQELQDLETRFEGNVVPENQEFPVQELYIQTAYSQRLKQEIQKQHEVIQQRTEEVETARAAYIEASRDTEVLEKLKDKKKQSYNEFVAKQEEIFLDELVVQRQGLIK